MPAAVQWLYSLEVCFLGFSCFLPRIDIYTCNGVALYKLALWGLRVVVSVDGCKGTSWVAVPPLDQ